MDKIEKFLRRLTKKEQKIVSDMLSNIVRGEYTQYDVKKMKGYSNLHRVRFGKMRIVFIEEKSDIRILLIARRDDRTYSDL